MSVPADESSCTAVVEAYGARLAVSAPDTDVLNAIVGSLPRGWTVCSPEVHHKNVKWRFGVVRDGDAYRVRDDRNAEHPVSDLDLAIWMLRSQMRRFVGYHSTDLIFVHAGVVAYQGAALVLPGASFAGKSTLVAALVGSGADFYSDEYAMLDQDGLVAHYREPLSVRGPRGQEEIELGSGSAQAPIAVGLVAFTVYRPGAVWAPRPLTIGEGVVAMMEHTVPARDRPAETLAILRLALTNAQLLQSERGAAEETANALLEAMAASTS